MSPHAYLVGGVRLSHALAFHMPKPVDHHLISLFIVDFFLFQTKKIFLIAKQMIRKNSSRLGTYYFPIIYLLLGTYYYCFN